HVSVDTTSRVDRFGNRVIVVAGDNDRIAVRIDPADNADMATAVSSHHSDCADLGPGHARAITRIGAGESAAASMAGALEDQVHEGAAPEAAAFGGVGSDVFTCLRDQRIASGTTIGGTRVRLSAGAGLRRRTTDVAAASADVFAVGPHGRLA